MNLEPCNRLSKLSFETLFELTISQLIPLNPHNEQFSIHYVQTHSLAYKYKNIYTHANTHIQQYNQSLINRPGATCQTHIKRVRLSDF